MVSRIVLNSHPASYLKKEIAKQNITGYSKLKKPALVELMLKHKQKFNHIKHNFSTKDKSQQKPTPKLTNPLLSGKMTTLRPPPFLCQCNIELRRPLEADRQCGLLLW